MRLLALPRLPLPPPTNSSSLTLYRPGRALLILFSFPLSSLSSLILFLLLSHNLSPSLPLSPPLSFLSPFLLLSCILW